VSRLTQQLFKEIVYTTTRNYYFQALLLDLKIATPLTFGEYKEGTVDMSLLDSINVALGKSVAAVLCDLASSSMQECYVWSAAVSGGKLHWHSQKYGSGH
jgi:hypothetical protein